MRCFYVNANSHCSNAPRAVCATTDDCQQFGRGGLCIEGWIETDFEFSLTPRQPIVWRISDGLPTLPLAGWRYAEATSAVHPRRSARIPSSAS